MIAVAFVFWLSAGAIVYTHVGYPLLLRLIARKNGDSKKKGGDLDSQIADLRRDELPHVSLIIAAHDEQDVIERKLENSLALDYPSELFEVIVASDGSSDRTVELATAFARRDPRVKVLDLERAGKINAQNTAVDTARGELLAFSDANAYWEPDALLALVSRFEPERVGYVCGELRLLDAEGSNQEGAYWRFEAGTRLRESRLRSITAGNGAIYAVRREAYLRLDPRTSHDLSFPFNLVKQGWKALYEPAARATEHPLPTNEGEFARKRRMMSHAWPMVLGGGLLNPRGYGAVYAFEIFSHRALRYATPLLHVVALGCNLALLGEGTIYGITLAAQGALVCAALIADASGGRPRVFALCQYYLLVTASIAAGFWDWRRSGTPATWEKAEGRI